MMLTLGFGGGGTSVICQRCYMFHSEVVVFFLYFYFLGNNAILKCA